MDVLAPCGGGEVAGLPGVGGGDELKIGAKKVLTKPAATQQDLLFSFPVYHKLLANQESMMSNFFSWLWRELCKDWSSEHASVVPYSRIRREGWVAYWFVKKAFLDGLAPGGGGEVAGLAGDGGGGELKIGSSKALTKPAATQQDLLSWIPVHPKDEMMQDFRFSYWKSLFPIDKA